jgi:hypothetical protein
VAFVDIGEEIEVGNQARVHLWHGPQCSARLSYARPTVPPLSSAQRRQKPLLEGGVVKAYDQVSLNQRRNG